MSTILSLRRHLTRSRLGILLLGSSLSFGLTPNAFALENSATVHLQPILKASKSWDGTPITYPSGQAEITGLLIEIAPGGETGWHSHPAPSFGMILEGSLDVTLIDGRVKHLEKGDTLLEVVNTAHNGKNNGTTPLKFIVFYAGAEGQKLSVKESGKETVKP
jgi:quercetin dioxygenase-like cupin family protein